MDRPVNDKMSLEALRLPAARMEAANRAGAIMRSMGNARFCFLTSSLIFGLLVLLGVVLLALRYEYSIPLLKQGESVVHSYDVFVSAFFFPAVYGSVSVAVLGFFVWLIYYRPRMVKLNAEFDAMFPDIVDLPIILLKREYALEKITEEGRGFPYADELIRLQVRRANVLFRSAPAAARKS